MPMFIVRGVDPATRSVEEFTIEAESDEQARRQLRAMGVLCEADATPPASLPSAPLPPAPRSAIDWPDHPHPATPRVSRRGAPFICQNPRCDYYGPRRRVPRMRWYEFLIGLVLVVLLVAATGIVGVIAGLIFVIYVALNLGYRESCPNCAAAL